MGQSRVVHAVVVLVGVLVVIAASAQVATAVMIVDVVEYTHLQVAIAALTARAKRYSANGTYNH